MDYHGAQLAQIAFPMGGIGAGMICLEGNGALAKFSLRNRPDLAREHKVFAAISIQQPHAAARVLEGPVPAWKLRPQLPGEWGLPPNTCWGLPRFPHVTFKARFPFATVRLEDPDLPLRVELTGWSPFSPGDSDGASLPVAGLEYRFANRSDASVEAVFSFNAENFMTCADSLDESSRSSSRILSTQGGFIVLQPADAQRPWAEGHFAAWVDEPDAKVNHVWFRGRPPAQMEMLWNDIITGRCATRGPDPDQTSPGASIFVPFRLAAGETRTIELHLAWYVPRSNVFAPNFRLSDGKLELIAAAGGETYRPWYAGRFGSIEEIRRYWQNEYRRLRRAAEGFSQTFYDSTLPGEVIEAVAANLAILKSPTILRQIDGRLWGWEGVYDEAGSCYGSSNHVWNYAQSIAHLFPDLERTLRETELGPNLGRDGFQAIRAALPIRPVGDSREDAWGFPAAADGQLGGIIKVYREWRIGADTAWLRRLWPKIKVSLDYCIRAWDPNHRGWIEEPHINTYDVEVWGPDSLCSTVYLGALTAARRMGNALGEDVDDYDQLHARALRQIEGELFNGEYFIQRTAWKNLRAPFPPVDDSPLASIFRQYPEMLELARDEGPPYQYGNGCLSDGVLGAWLCWTCGVGDILDHSKVDSHLAAVYRYNFNKSLRHHTDQSRPFLACGQEAGLVVCSWPKGGRPVLPLFFADEVWTGVEYQVASHLISVGRIHEGLDIVRSCRRRYDGSVRNPFDEVEAGHWYARAMASYALLQAFSGARFDAVDGTLYLQPAIKGDFRCFLSTASGYGTVGVENGKPFVEIVSGQIPYKKIEYRARLACNA